MRLRCFDLNREPHIRLPVVMNSRPPISFISIIFPNRRHLQAALFFVCNTFEVRLYVGAIVKIGLIFIVIPFFAVNRAGRVPCTINISLITSLFE